MSYPTQNLPKPLIAFIVGGLITGNVLAQTTRVTVKIENVAPMTATSQTPVWIGLHDGQAFDIYNTGSAADSLPVAGSRAFESICEDGSAVLLAADFTSLQADGLQATLAGPNGPIAPGEFAEFTFEVESSDPNVRYLSYASMILPSNDFCVANADPKEHELFDEQGNFVAESFFVAGDEALDAGTEVNDEEPENTAFFGQTTPNTGVDEDGVVGPAEAGFLSVDQGGILADERFREADFTQRGYSFLKFTFAAEEVVEEPEPEITENLNLGARLAGSNVVPAVNTRAIGAIRALLRNRGTTLNVNTVAIRLAQDVDIIGAELRMAPAGENGPVVVDFLAESDFTGNGILRRLLASLDSTDLVGPLAGRSLSALVRAIQDSEIYLLIKTTEFPDGHLRGQLR